METTRRKDATAIKSRTSPHDLSFDQISALTYGRIGQTDIPCPLCSSSRSKKNQNKPVFRIWRDAKDFLTFHCVHCGEKGSVRSGDAVPVDVNRVNELKCEAAKRDREERLRRIGKARAMWSFSREIRGTLAERYLRDVRGIRCQIPATLRFLPASRHEYFPAMIAAYGIPIEPEPGLLQIADADVKGIQLTLLAPDGTKAKSEDGPSKIAIGPSLGWPIVVAPVSDGLALSISEGIENALSAHECTGMGAWASTGAKKLAALAPAVPSYIESVSIFADDDADGRAGAAALFTALARRDIEVWAEFTPYERAAA